MPKPSGTTLGILILLALALAFGAPSGAAADDCALLGGTGAAGADCVITGATPVIPTAPNPAGETCAFTLDRTLHIVNTGKLTIPAACTANVRPPFVPALGTASTPGFKVTITATSTAPANPNGFQMDAGSQVIGDQPTTGHAADIEFKVLAGDISLAGDAPQPGPKGAIIQSNRGATCNTVTARGGNITLDAQATLSHVTQGAGSKIHSISPCGRGEIDIFATFVTLDGDVLSQGTSTVGRGGPITVKAACDLKVAGSVVSKGSDPGSDLVHLQGGCTVTIWGLVASTGSGHAFIKAPPPAGNRCDSTFRPDKPTNSSSCVEIWSGGPLDIDAKTHNGEVHADTAQSGGIEGFGWIALYAKKNVTITGDTVAPFAVHANQFLGNGHGGLIDVTSTEGQVSLTGLAIQANDTASGGSGSRPNPAFPCTTSLWCGGITIEAKTDVDFRPDGVVEAKGATSGGAPNGGRLDVQAFTGAIFATGGAAGSKVDVTGGNPANGVVNLTACTTPIAAFPPGTVVPAAVSATHNSPVCPAVGPSLPVYSADFGIPALPPLPDCVCEQVGACACLNDFTPTGAAAISAAGQVTINGLQLLNTTQVWFSSDCNVPLGTPTQQGQILPGGSNATIQVNPQAAILQNMHIILVCPTGTFCSAAVIGP